MSLNKTILLLGATGFTGTLIAKELVRNSISFTLGGRSIEKLNALNEDLGGKINCELIDVEKNIMQLKGYDLIINCVGPFNLWGNTVVDHCIANGKIYMDITGEQEFVKRSYDKQEEAKNTGASIIHSVSFESCLADLMLMEDWSPNEKYASASSYYFFKRGRPSGGTKLSMQLAKYFPNYTLKDFELVKCNSVAFMEEFHIDTLPEITKAVFMPYPEVLFFKSRKNIKNSSSFVLLDDPDTRILQSTTQTVKMTIEEILAKHYRSITKGPTLEERKKQGFVLILRMKTESGVAIERRLEGNDMYGITAFLIARLTKRIMDGKALEKGVISPAQAFNGDKIWNDLVKENLTQKLN